MIYKFLVLVLIIIGSNNSNSFGYFEKLEPEQSANLDIDYYNYLLSKWNSDYTISYSREKTKYFRSYLKNIDKSDVVLLQNEYLSIPDSNILVANYINTKIIWSTYYNRENRSIQEIVEWQLKNIPSRNELLVFYWRNIFICLGNNIYNQTSSNLNIELSELNLSENEKSILFLIFIEHYASHLNSYALANVTTNCDNVNKHSDLLPHFDNQHFTEFKLPNSEDFVFEWSQHKDKYSFKEKCLESYNIAVREHGKCKKK